MKVYGQDKANTNLLMLID